MARVIRKEMAILKKMPIDILLLMTNEEISKIFNVKESQISTLLTEKIELNKNSKNNYTRINEIELNTFGAWNELKQTQLYIQLKLKK